MSLAKSSALLRCFTQNAFAAFSIETKASLDHCSKSICKYSKLFFHFLYGLWSRVTFLKALRFDAMWRVQVYHHQQRCFERGVGWVLRSFRRRKFFFHFFGFLWDETRRALSYSLAAYAISIKAREVVHVDMKGARRNGQINNYMITRQKPRPLFLWLFNVMWPHWSSLFMGPKAGGAWDGGWAGVSRKDHIDNHSQKSFAGFTYFPQRAKLF